MRFDLPRRYASVVLVGRHGSDRKFTTWRRVPDAHGRLDAMNGAASSRLRMCPPAAGAVASATARMKLHCRLIEADTAYAGALYDDAVAADPIHGSAQSLE